MEIMALAKNMELEGKAYYRKLAKETQIKVLKGIFSFLAEEEQRHYELFDLVEKNGKVPKTDNTSIKVKLKEVFSTLTKSFEIPISSNDYAAAFRKAFDMETKAVKYYEEIKEKIDCSLHPFVEFIINQEKSHAKLMESLIDFVNAPQVWLENAEWNHLDLY